MTSENNKRIAKNTMFLYFRMLLVMGVSLYTSRIVLNTLGVEDYGIYNVVGGVVLLFSSINTTMATAIQRFMNYEMGKNNFRKLNLIFNISIIIHLGIAVLLFLLLEIIGVWFLNTKMNISSERMEAANWVLQFSIFSFLVTILSVPYNAAIIANEKMKAFAVISILEVSLKLLIVFSLNWVSFDKLKFYAVLMFLLSVILRLTYGIYAKKKFPECNFKWEWNKKICKEMSVFAGWNLIGVSSTLIRTQGVNIVLNIFYGVVVNAAMGIANQVKIAMENFTNNFLIALNPQITKSFAAGDTNYLFSLVFKGSRYAFFLLLFLTLPIILETEILLKIWLKTVPEYTVIFVRLILIVSIIESLSKTLIQSMFATGKIRRYQLIVGSITIMNLPLSLLFLYFEYPPSIVFIIAIFIAIISLFVRLFLLQGMINLKIQDFISNVLVTIFIVGIGSFLLPFIVYNLLETSYMRLLLLLFLCAVSTIGSIYFIGLSNNERAVVKEKVQNFLKLKI